MAGVRVLRRYHFGWICSSKLRFGSPSDTYQRTLPIKRSTPPTTSNAQGHLVGLSALRCAISSVVGTSRTVNVSSTRICGWVGSLFSMHRVALYTFASIRVASKSIVISSALPGAVVPLVGESSSHGMSVAVQAPLVWGASSVTVHSSGMLPLLLIIMVWLITSSGF